MTEQTEAAPRRRPGPSKRAAAAKTLSPSALAVREAALDLFFRQGYNGTSLRQLADEVGMQVGSLYNHISSKEQLLFEIMRQVMLDLIEASKLAVEGLDDPLDRLRAFFGAGVRYYAQHQREALIGNSELRALPPARRAEIIALRDKYQRTLEKLLQAVADAGQAEIEDVKVAAYAGVAMYLHVAAWYRPDGRLDIDDIERILSDMYSPTRTR
ncbi:TetR family transcriptional regulator [Nocardia huaxiensis]|uniref:TetR family transcriptional regulator n=1 Tax=Nocardia huaxiensis TaxID=2755382 RepID=UPI001E2CF693|nr:TetR family transcriptional regulator [Nocardia huaxiensis]UFS98529.1 TetR family transcriptional regulator [Nocardia huaxiensis]